MYNSMYYNGFNPYINSPKLAGKGIFSGISKINWGNLLNNTQKTLNVINQAIPVYYQVKPIYNNAKTMFKVIGSFNDKTETKKSLNNYYETNYNKKNIDNKPIFFS